MNFKKKLKRCLPPIIVDYGMRLLKYNCSYNGNYKNWQEALKNSYGYDDKDILNKVKAASLKVKAGEALYERDGVLFYQKEVLPIVTWLLFISSDNGGNLRILDFGGSLGSTYYKYKDIFDNVIGMQYCIVEQEHYVECGRKFLETDKLKFYYTIEECQEEVSNKIDVVLLACTLQYFDKPYDYLQNILSANIEYIIIDSTCFHDMPDRIVIQTIPKKIYKSSYPAWVFNRNKFIEYMGERYKLLFEWDSLEGSRGMFLKDDKCRELPYKGMMFKIKKH